MRTVSIFSDGKHQTIQIPKDMAFNNAKELEITKNGDVITLRPVFSDWLSFANYDLADDDFIVERVDVVSTAFEK